MRIVWVTKVVPHTAITGDRVYSANLARSLAAAGAQVWALGMDEGGEQGAVEEHPNLRWIRVFTQMRGTVSSLLRPLPLVVERHSPLPMRERFRTLCQEVKPDVVIIDNYAAGWALDEADRHWPQCLVVYVAHNHEALLAQAITRDFRGNPLRRLLLKINEKKIAYLERRLAKRSSVLVALTDIDKQRFSDGHANIVVIPPGYNGPRKPVRTIGPAQEKLALILGSLRWIAKQMNMEAFLKAADKRLADKGIKVVVAGDADEAFVAKWSGRLSAFEFVGFVPDPTEIMERARMGLVIEATGGGFKLKLLDYIFNRVPILALAGSTAGMSEAIISHIRVANGMDALVDDIIKLSDDFDVLNALQDGAYRAAEREFDWQTNGEVLFAAIGDRLASQRR